MRGFVGLFLLSVILSLSGGRRLCVCCVRRFLRFVRLFLTAVCFFQHFCADRFFLSFFFAPIFLYCWCPFLYFFSAVECCLLRFVFFRHFRIINWGFPRLDGLFYVICLSLPLIAHFCVFFNVFFVRFVSCLSFFAFSAVVFFLLFFPVCQKQNWPGA